MPLHKVVRPPGSPSSMPNNNNTNMDGNKVDMSTAEFIESLDLDNDFGDHHDEDEYRHDRYGRRQQQQQFDMDMDMLLQSRNQSYEEAQQEAHRQRRDKNNNHEVEEEEEEERVSIGGEPQDSITIISDVNSFQNSDEDTTINTEIQQQKQQQEQPRYKSSSSARSASRSVASTGNRSVKSAPNKPQTTAMTKEQLAEQAYNNSSCSEVKVSRHWHQAGGRKAYSRSMSGGAASTGGSTHRSRSSTLSLRKERQPKRNDHPREGLLEFELPAWALELGDDDESSTGDGTFFSQQSTQSLATKQLLSQGLASIREARKEAIDAVIHGLPLPTESQHSRNTAVYSAISNLPPHTKSQSHMQIMNSIASASQTSSSSRVKEKVKEVAPEDDVLVDAPPTAATDITPAIPSFSPALPAPPTSHQQQSGVRALEITTKDTVLLPVAVQSPPQSQPLPPKQQQKVMVTTSVITPLGQQETSTTIATDGAPVVEPQRQLPQQPQQPPPKLTNRFHQEAPSQHSTIVQTCTMTATRNDATTTKTKTKTTPSSSSSSSSSYQPKSTQAQPKRLQQPEAKEGSLRNEGEPVSEAKTNEFGLWTAPLGPALSASYSNFMDSDAVSDTPSVTGSDSGIDDAGFVTDVVSDTGSNEDEDEDEVSETGSSASIPQKRSGRGRSRSRRGQQPSLSRGKTPSSTSPSSSLYSCSEEESDSSSTGGVKQPPPSPRIDYRSTMIKDGKVPAKKHALAAVDQRQRQASTKARPSSERYQPSSASAAASSQYSNDYSTRALPSKPPMSPTKKGKSSASSHISAPQKTKKKKSKQRRTPQIPIPEVDSKEETSSHNSPSADVPSPPQQQPEVLWIHPSGEITTSNKAPPVDHVNTVPNKNNMPRLHTALYRGAPLVELYELAAKAKKSPGVMEARDPLGNTPLHIACMAPHTRNEHAARLAQSVRMLTPDSTSQSQSLAQAQAQAQTVGAAYNRPYYEGDSILLVIQLLYNLCPRNIKRKNADGNLPLHLAVLSATATATILPSHCQTVSILSHENPNHDAATNASTKVGSSQLWLDIIGKIIFEYPRALHMPNRNGRAPLDLAIHKQGSCPEVVELIEEEISLLGDNFSSTDGSGRGGETTTTFSAATPSHPVQDHQYGRVDSSNAASAFGSAGRFPQSATMSNDCEQHYSPSSPSTNAPYEPPQQTHSLAPSNQQPSGDDPKYPPILFEEDPYRPPPMKSSAAVAKFLEWNPLESDYDIFELMQSKRFLIVFFLLTFTGLLFLPKSATHHPIRVAFIGNSITFVNDLPRFMEALSNGYISQNSCLHGATRLRTILYSGNGMNNKWQTDNAIIQEVSEDDDLYYYVDEGDDDDDGGAYEGPHVIYDYGACSVPQLLMGTDPNMVAYNANGQYRDDGKNPCIEDPAYLRYTQQLYVEMIRVHRLEAKQEENDDVVLQLWDYVVLNDQTLVPAIDEERERSEQVLKYVYAPYFKKIHARPVLLATHAYSYDAEVQFDDGYDFVWEDVPTFSSALYQGYLRYVDILTQALPPGQEPLLVPAGLAFLVVWEENFSMWERLFYVDGFHPSPHGTFLIGCVLYATLYNRMPGNIPHDVSDLWAQARRMEINLEDDYAMPIPTQEEAIYLAGIAERVTLRNYMPKSYVADMS